MDQKKVKIIFCGTDRQTTELLKDALADRNYLFQEFKDIEEAIQQIRPGDYHVLLLGLCQEPEKGKLDGLHAIPILRKIDPTLPIIAVAPHDSLDLMRQVRMAGVFYYLLQPLDLNEVRMSVTNAVSKYERLI